MDLDAPGGLLQCRFPENSPANIGREGLTGAGSSTLPGPANRCPWPGCGGLFGVPLLAPGVVVGDV